MEYNDIWDLDLNGLKLEKYYGKPFLSHGQLEYSFEPTINIIESILKKFSKSDINTLKEFKKLPDFNVKNNNVLQNINTFKKEFGGKILNTKIENGKKYFLINE